jgi:biotin synthase
MDNKIFLCAISNITSGNCGEDCSFCTQSSRYKTDIEKYKKKPINKIIDEAKRAKSNGAIGFCLVTSGKGLNDKKVEFISKVAREIKKSVSGLSLIACNGTANIEQLKELKKSGIDNYNHNLETSQNYYKTICSTHSWEERFQTCLNIKKVGLNLCTGGIFGMGESLEDRASLMHSIKELNPKSIPLNFYHPNPALPIKKANIDENEALEIIKQMREFLPQSMIMVAGGREITFKTKFKDIFKFGANSIVIGDYLTTSGEAINKDLKIIKELGLEIATNC